MHQYNPVVFGRRLKLGVVPGQTAPPEFLREAAGSAAMGPYVGGLNSLASQPSASEVMGSFDTTVVSTRPHFWHSNVR
jgi:hypothetical protein